MAPPVRAVVVFIPDAVPTLSRGTEPRIALWFGELNIAQPKPIRSNGKMIRGTDASTDKEAMKNWPMTMIPEPMVQSRREPMRSDNQPARGATMTITTELAMIIQPICVGENRRTSCK